jgi:hypothetical protein
MAKKETKKTEDTSNIEDNIINLVVEPIVSTKEIVVPINVTEKEEYIKPMSLEAKFKDIFSKVPFIIFQNGVQVHKSNENDKIELNDTTFSLNGKVFNYAGIEVRHI